MNRDIKVHCDERMREHMAFVMRRYIDDCRRGIAAAQQARGWTKEQRAAHVENYIAQIDLSEICLKELEHAGI